MKWSYLLLLNLFTLTLFARIVNVGTGYAYSSPAALQNQLRAGDTVLIHAGNYTGTFFLSNISGTAGAPIVIKSAPNETVLFAGGTESFHFSNVSYLEIADLIIEKQTGNGMNIDDGGSLTNPSNHIIIRNCIFRNINATGNNDLLKLSGIDDFTVQDCIFQKGSPGGSGVDMVGCHRGSFIRNKFTDQGSNSIQIKGGSEFISITQNSFIRGGARVLNIGGSTGLEFFRPQNATFEANRVTVFANVFDGGETPFAFVGAVNSIVFNNTIIRPGKWAMRILQETVNTSRFQPCGKDSVINNIFILNGNVSTEVNIGPDTAPNTFFYSNNLWFKENQPNWPGPSSLPKADTKQIIGNPQLDFSTYKAGNTSLLFQKGQTIRLGVKDYVNSDFKNPPSIGATEIAMNTTPIPILEKSNTKVYPNPGGEVIKIELNESGTYILYTASGKQIQSGKLQKGINTILMSTISSGIYFIKIVSVTTEIIKWIKV
jgi:hypothetical protein